MQSYSAPQTKTVMDIQYLFPLSFIKLTKLYQLVSRKIRDPSAPATRNQKRSEAAVPDGFLSPPFLNISYCQSGPHPTLMIGKAAEGSHTCAHTHTNSHGPCSQTHTHTHTDWIIRQWIRQVTIIWIKLLHRHATGGSNKTCAWHAEQQQQ